MGYGMSLLKVTVREHLMVSSLRDNWGRRHNPGPFVSISDMKEKGHVLQRNANPCHKYESTTTDWR